MTDPLGESVVADLEARMRGVLWANQQALDAVIASVRGEIPLSLDSGALTRASFSAARLLRYVRRAMDESPGVLELRMEYLQLMDSAVRVQALRQRLA